MSTLPLLEELTLTHKELHVNTPTNREAEIDHKEPHVNTPTARGADIDSQGAACQHSHC